MEPILDFAINLPEKGSRELLRSLHRQLRAAIVDGRLQAGLRLPPTRALARGLGISRNTAIAAYDMLLSEGYVEGRKGAGTFVADVRPRLEPLKASLGADPVADRRLAPTWRGWRPLAETCSGETYRYDFVAGMPDSEFPFDIWQRLSTRASRAVARSPIKEHDPAGEPPLRQAIASHISFVRAVACQPDDIVVTAGARQAIDLIARILVTPGETEVALEDPGYGPTRRSFVAAGAKILSVPVDEEGLLVERLPPSTRVICVTPSHQFPLGVAMSARRRAALLDFAESFGAVIVEDDYDSEFRHGGMPLDALQTLDRSGSVFYVGTFSKSMFPALRMGFVVVPEWARYALTLAKQMSDWHSPLINQLALADFIAEGHLARHVRKMRRVYSARYEALRAALNSHIGDRLRPFRAHAGVHLAAELTVPGDEQAVVARAATRRIRVEDIARYATRDIVQKGFVFGFGMIEVQDIEPAIAELSDIGFGSS
ncbi:PLP-dependent aminotransferase family protein [Chelativorans sp. M5D2P16]|uniref:MocR-like pyridoxine biosynthesis transcription factor PdxR n=1 Tax=Chelativorans sp. M5D2P16 TaxID=3095678 RepID=UPI002ACA8DC8|nr:PLP-dependent aminotransferase family protein [Chelativorans sp. M5D2P16]MDZ5699501.1 PLP-dependent aminotransferase family protein [Chelativorans sp. M5D2P16]